MEVISIERSTYEKLMTKDSVSAKKEKIFFVLRSTFRNFVRIRRISLNKGSLGN